MLKRITASELRLGMFIDRLDGSWLEHSFWRGRFLLEDPRDLERVRESGIDALWIDTSKGLDVAAPQAASAGAAPPDPAPAPQVRPTGQPKCSINDELARAASIVRKAKPAVVSMFNEIRMGRAIDAEKALPLVQEISDSVARNHGALIGIARLKDKDEYTYMHSVAVCALMIALARQLNVDDSLIREIGLAGLLHDVGKAMIPPAVLNKPGKLTDAEFDLVKTHPERGRDILVASATVGEIPIDVCLHHHERVDGTGYPHRLKGEQITLYARMGAICDVYDAVTSNRPYKNGWDPAESIQKMAGWCKTHFDEAVFQAFVKAMGIYPVGSLVRMQSERLGIVVEQGSSSLLTPMVKVFFSLRSQMHIEPESVDLAAKNCSDRIVAREDPQRWNFPHLNELFLSGVTAH